MQHDATPIEPLIAGGRGDEFGSRRTPAHSRPEAAMPLAIGDHRLARRHFAHRLRRLERAVGLAAWRIQIEDD